MKHSTLLFCLAFFTTTLTAQTGGDAFFSEWTVHEIRFQFSQPGYWDSLKTNYTQDVYMRCDVTVDGVDYPTSGVKFKGNSSYNNPGNKKPFRIDFAEYTDTQEFDGLKKLVLNNAFKDPTFLREKLTLDFMQAHGIAGPRATFAKLYINGHYWGLYSVVEDVNKTFLKDHFDNKGGNLFKGDPKGSLVWKGVQQSLYQQDYELKTNETANDWSDLIRFVNVLNNTPTPQLRDSLDRYLNLPGWYSYWAVQNLFVNLDSYIGSGHNYFLYHNTDTDKFEWIAWDMNEAFGNFQMGISLANIKILPYNFIPQPANQRPMMNKVWQDPILKQQYADRLCALLADFSNQKMDARIDSLANLIRPFVYADSLKFYGNNIFEQNLTQDVSLPNVPGASGIAGLKSFIAARRMSLLQQLATVGCATTDASEASFTSGISLFPNPAGEEVVITTGALPIQNIRLLSAQGTVLRSMEGVNSSKASLDLRGLPPGVYFVVISAGKAVFCEKLIITR